MPDHSNLKTDERVTAIFNAVKLNNFPEFENLVTSAPPNFDFFSPKQNDHSFLATCLLSKPIRTDMICVLFEKDAKLVNELINNLSFVTFVNKKKAMLTPMEYKDLIKYSLKAYCQQCSIERRTPEGLALLFPSAKKGMIKRLIEFAKSDPSMYAFIFNATPKSMTNPPLLNLAATSASTSIPCHPLFNSIIKNDLLGLTRSLLNEPNIDLLALKHRGYNLFETALMVSSNRSNIDIIALLLQKEPRFATLDPELLDKLSQELTTLHILEEVLTAYMQLAADAAIAQKLTDYFHKYQTSPAILQVYQTALFSVKNKSPIVSPADEINEPTPNSPNIDTASPNTDSPEISKPLYTPQEVFAEDILASIQSTTTDISESSKLRYSPQEVFSEAILASIQSTRPGSTPLAQAHPLFQYIAANNLSDLSREVPAIPTSSLLYLKHNNQNLFEFAVSFSNIMDNTEIIQLLLQQNPKLATDNPMLLDNLSNTANPNLPVLTETLKAHLLLAKDNPHLQQKMGNYYQKYQHLSQIMSAYQAADTAINESNRPSKRPRR